MTREFEIDSALSAEERAALTRLAERLERERPLPHPAFRGDLRRLLLSPTQAPPPPARWKALAASYAGAGLLCLLVAAAGLAGLGPFAA